MISLERTIAIYKCLIFRQTKADCHLDLTVEEQHLWDKMEAEMRTAEASGRVKVWDIPRE